jgi:hypothetical protein
MILEVLNECGTTFFRNCLALEDEGIMILQTLRTIHPVAH